MKNPLQAHSAKYNIQYQSEIHIAERACKDTINDISQVSKAHLQLEIQKLQMSLVPQFSLIKIVDEFDILT